MPNIPRRANKRPWIAPHVAFENAPGLTNKFYQSSQWRKFRAVFLQRNPLCVMCKERGILTKATTVDHIISINPANGWDMENGKYPHPLDANNCQALCFRCHAKKTGETKKQS
jgi:5-methylcytosine-specific restriction endonuclease McrA